MKTLPDKLGKFFRKTPNSLQRYGTGMGYCFCKKISELEAHLQANSWTETIVPKMHPTTSVWTNTNESVAVSVIHNRFAFLVKKPDLEKLASL